MPIKSIILDLDGVLIDSVPTQIAAWSETFHRFGYDFGRDDYFRLVDGRPVRDGAGAVMTDVPEDVISAAVDFKESLYRDMVATGACKPFDCALRFIERRRQEGTPMAVASSSNHARCCLKACRFSLFSNASCVATQYPTESPRQIFF